MNCIVKRLERILATEHWLPKSHQTRSAATAATFVAALVNISCTVTAADFRPEIVTWADNTPEWNERLGVTLMRQGCSSSPDKCVQWMRASAKAQKVSRWALSVGQEPSRWPDAALEYSRLSLLDPVLVEVDIDDFLGTLKTWNQSTGGRGAVVLADVTQNLKHHNPRLRFGVTIYEDELDSPILASIPIETRERVDRVSLYLHYRGNAGSYASYVAKARRLFPRAEIWAGSYAYDRISYLPCIQSDSRPCAEEEEIDLFRASLQIQTELLRAGTIAGIEFYPGFFGKEEQWSGWDRKPICPPDRRQQCIDITRRMRKIVAEEFQRADLPGESIDDGAR